MFAAADGGELAGEDVRGLLIDYIAPSLDTTILGTGHLLYLLGSHPEQYERVRAQPEAIPGAVHEALRFESPVRAFTRYAASDYDAGGVTIAKGERALILYGSANRDERRYADPDRFDRRPRRARPRRVRLRRPPLRGRLPRAARDGGAAPRAHDPRAPHRGRRADLAPQQRPARVRGLPGDLPSLIRNQAALEADRSQGAHYW